MLNVDFTPLTLMIVGLLFAAMAVVVATIIGRRISRRGGSRDPRTGI